MEGVSKAAIFMAAMSNREGTAVEDITLHAIGPAQEPFSVHSAPLSRWPHLLSSALARTDYELTSLEAERPGTPAVADVDLTTLQRLNLYHLQHRLVVLVCQITIAKKHSSEVPLATMDDVHDCLKCYCR